MPVFPAQQLNWLNAWKIKEKVVISDDLFTLAGNVVQLPKHQNPSECNGKASFCSDFLKTSYISGVRALRTGRSLGLP